MIEMTSMDKDTLRKIDHIIQKEIEKWKIEDEDGLMKGKKSKKTNDPSQIKISTWEDFLLDNLTIPILAPACYRELIKIDKSNGLKLMHIYMNSVRNLDTIKSNKLICEFLETEDIQKILEDNKNEFAEKVIPNISIEWLVTLYDLGLELYLSSYDINHSEEQLVAKLRARCPIRVIIGDQDLFLEIIKKFEAFDKVIYKRIFESENPCPIDLKIREHEELIEQLAIVSSPISIGGNHGERI